MVTQPTAAARLPATSLALRCAHGFVTTAAATVVNVLEIKIPHTVARNGQTLFVPSDVEVECGLPREKGDVKKELRSVFDRDRVRKVERETSLLPWGALPDESSHAIMLTKTGTALPDSRPYHSRRD
jgi:hypothetical protein